MLSLQVQNIHHAACVRYSNLKLNSFSVDFKYTHTNQYFTFQSSCIHEFNFIFPLYETK